jgi:hypothetical protein
MIFGGQWDCGHFMSVGARPELRLKRKMPIDNARPVMVALVGSQQK